MPPLFNRPSVPNPRTTSTFRGRARVPVRPWLPNPDDDAPVSAVPFMPGRCDACPAAARTVFAGIVVSTPEGWVVQQVGVVDLHLCGHHTARMEPLLESDGWVMVADTRSRVAG